MNHGALRHIFLAAVAALASASPGPASANCAAPAFEVVWTYPSAGMQDVPTNATFWAVGTRGFGTAQLDGKLLPNGEHGEILAGPLEAHRTYTLRFVYPDQPAGGSFTFRTASGPVATSPETPRVVDAEAGGSGPVALGFDCLDQPPYTRLELQLAQRATPQGDLLEPGPHLIDGQFSTRGNPAILVPGDSVEGACVDVAAIGQGGLLGPSARYCVPEQNDGCTSHGSAHGPWLPLLALALSLRRRTGARRSAVRDQGP